MKTLLASLAGALLLAGCAVAPVEGPYGYGYGGTYGYGGAYDYGYGYGYGPSYYGYYGDYYRPYYYSPPIIGGFSYYSGGRHDRRGHAHRGGRGHWSDDRSSWQGDSDVRRGSAARSGRHAGSRDWHGGRTQRAAPHARNGGNPQAHSRTSPSER
jgi:hypothetical protein